MCKDHGSRVEQDTTSRLVKLSPKELQGSSVDNQKSIITKTVLKGIYPEFQVIRGFSQKILAGLLSYDQIHS